MSEIRNKEPLPKRGPNKPTYLVKLRGGEEVGIDDTDLTVTFAPEDRETFVVTDGLNLLHSFQRVQILADACPPTALYEYNGTFKGTIRPKGDLPLARTYEVVLWTKRGQCIRLQVARQPEKSFAFELGGRSIYFDARNKPAGHDPRTFEYDEVEEDDRV